MIKVSFIVPVYNVEDYIQECLESLLKQDINEKEILIINDGSTDKSLEICEKYKNKHSCIKIINKANGGLSSARNKGIEVAKGEYIFFVDSDDFLLGNYINEMYENCKKNNIDIFRGVYTRYDNRSKILENIILENKEYYDKVMSGIDFLENEIKYDSYEVIACLGLFKKEYLDKNRIRFTEGVTYEDHEFFMKCLLSSTDSRVIKKNKLIYAYRDRDGSITKVPKIENINDMINNINRMNLFIDSLNMNGRDVKIAKVPISITFNHMISLYYRLPKKHKKGLYSEIRKNVKYNMVKYAYNLKQHLKILIFMYFRGILDLIFYFKNIY